MKNKICYKCKINKPLDQFSFKSKSKHKIQSCCKSCHSEYKKQHYLNNKDYYKNKSRKRNDKLKKICQENIIQYLKCHPCVDCKETDIIVLEFDHVRGKKLRNISNMIQRGCTWDQVELEIGKCEVRCRNCHARKTAKQFNYFKYRSS